MDCFASGGGDINLGLWTPDPRQGHLLLVSFSSHGGGMWKELGEEECRELGMVKETVHRCTQRPMTNVPGHLHQQAEPLMTVGCPHPTKSACTGNSRGSCGTPSPPKPMVKPLVHPALHLPWYLCSFYPSGRFISSNRGPMGTYHSTLAHQFQHEGKQEIEYM